MMRRSIYAVRLDTVRYERKLSLIAAVDSVESSHSIINSMMDIAEETGYPYEILISTRLPDEERYYYDEIRVISRNTKRRSDGLAKAIKSATGNYTFIFDPSINYSLSYADLIYGYINIGTSEVLVSNVIGFQTDVAINVGNWRPLVCGEDIDLMARALDSYGVISYPLGSLTGFDIGELIYGKKRSRIEKAIAMRDLVIAANLKHSDIAEMMEAMDMDIATYEWMMSGKILSYLSRIRPYEKNVNNYVFVMDRIIESYISQDYRRIDTISDTPKITLSPRTRRYLSAVSDLWTAQDTDNKYPKESI
ncbi:hypothetical protein [Thermoplasma sp.]|uniref:hypothetical protein n=1 Tax=Thermoplasma sp. TaxID=1973142 RepID=UPI00126FD8AB|nr:hypothetical protein [Thermoplasma sp.]KAA8923108.1 MAG: hypothetical protein F6Q11_01040 [Thermoplasma sp.]